MANRWKDYKEEIKAHFGQGGEMNSLLESFAGQMGLTLTKGSKDGLRKYVHRLKLNNSPSVIGQTLKANNMGDKDWNIAWIKDEKISLLVRNPKNAVGTKSLEDIRNEFKEDLKKYAPKFKKFSRKKMDKRHLLMIDIADLHIGKLATTTGSGDTYNVKIAKQRAFEGVQGLLSKVQGVNIDQIIFVIGNDVLHTDTMQRTTTNGTSQDTDGMWYDNFLIAREVYTTIVESLLTIADVHIPHNPSNHDFMSGFMLADTIYSWFRNHSNVTFDITNQHRKYFKYGNSLIGTSHGDGAKLDKLPLLMAEEAKQDWADTCYRYIYLHHLHSKHLYKFKAAEDFIGVTVEYLRSPSGTDAWHHKAGYQHAKKAIEGFLHSYESGQVARFTHLF